MPFAHTPRLKLYYERGGEGQSVLFISGTGGDLRNKPNQFNSPLTKNFELISYDQRGLGQSDNPDTAFTMAQYADDAAALLDELGIDRIPVVGVSFGGMVAQELILRHPNRVSCAVLACTSSGGEGGGSYPLHEIAHLDPLERATTHLQAADLRHTKAWIKANPDAWQKRVNLAVNNVRDDRDELGALKQLHARASHDTFARLAGIQCPLLLVGGEFDGVAPMKNMQHLADNIIDSELKFFQGGHMFLIQDKNAYPYIVQWLKGSLS
jgi:3-oxoadipate enol-lactonase